MFSEAMRGEQAYIKAESAAHICWFAADQLLSCPYTASHTDVQHTAVPLIVEWLNHVMRGQPLTDAWTAPQTGYVMQKASLA